MLRNKRNVLRSEGLLELKKIRMPVNKEGRKRNIGGCVKKLLLMANESKI